MEVPRPCSARLAVWWSILNWFCVSLGVCGLNTTPVATSMLAECDPATGMQTFYFPIIDAGQDEPEQHLTYGVLLDLIFRSHFDPAAKAIYGEPDEFLYRVPNLHPCLRLEFKLIPHMYNARQAVIHQTPYYHDDVTNVTVSNMTRTHAAFYGPDGSINTFAAQDADALDIVHTSPYLGTHAGERKQYPNFFRAASAVLYIFQPMWGFYKLYGWRALMIMYTMDDRMRDLFELFAVSVTTEGVPPSYVRSAPLSTLIPFQSEAILSQLYALREMPVRILFHFVQYGTEHKEKLGESFVDRILSLQMKLGLWIPTYQMVGSREFYQSAVFQNASIQAILGTSSGSIMFAESHLMEPSIYATQLPGFYWWLNKVATLGAVDLNKQEEQERYALDSWPTDAWQYALERFNFAGGLPEMLMSMPFAAQRDEWFKTDAAMRQVIAHSCFLHGGGNSSVRDAVLFRQCLVMASHDHTNLLVKLGYDYKQDNEDNFYLYNPVSVLDTVNNSVIQYFFNPILLSAGSDYMTGCFKAAENMGYHSPVWGTGVQDDNAPSELLNCTPGMFRTELGDCEWCAPGRSSSLIDADVCKSCPPGTYSLDRSPICHECPIGKHSAGAGSQTCDTCLSGTYAGTNGSSKCAFCPSGTWSNISEATACNSCEGGLTTKTPASITALDCICPKGTYTSQDDSCIDCMNGLACDEDWPNNWAAQGLTARSQPDHYILKSDPYSTYLCLPEFGGCPGGPPEFCDNGREGFLCTLCAASDRHVVNGKCELCPLYLRLVPLFFILAGLVLITCCYYLANGKLTHFADHPAALFVFIGLQVTTFQILGVFQKLEIPWPVQVDMFMARSSGVFSFDGNHISLSCAVGQSALGQYIVQGSLPFGLCALTMFVSVMTRTFRKISHKAPAPWSFSKSFNVCGQILQALFIAFCAIMVRPLQCYKHPNSKESVIIYPSVLCWEGIGHITLLAVASVILGGFIIPYVAGCVWACWKAPIKSCACDIAFLQTFRFLLYRFRPDCWWWGIVFLFRQTCLAFATVVPASNPHAQLFYTSFILAVYVVFAARFWPWINSEISIVDTGTCLLLLLTLMCASQFLPEPSETQGRRYILIALMIALSVVTVQFLLRVLIGMCLYGPYAEFNDQKPSRIELGEDWLNFLEHILNQDKVSHIETICRMNMFDRRKLLSMMHCWTAHATSGKSKTTRHTTRLHQLASAKLDPKVASFCSSRTGSLRSSLTLSESHSAPSAKESAARESAYGVTLLSSLSLQSKPEPSSEKMVFEHCIGKPASFKINASQGTPDISKPAVFAPALRASPTAILSEE